MDEDNLLIICRSCGRKVLMHNMKPDGENMVCLECYNKSAGVKSAVSVLAPEPKRTKVDKTEKLVKFICTNCKYKFSRKASQQVEKCPYCGKNTIVHDDQLGANKLINDSMNKKFDWWRMDNIQEYVGLVLGVLAAGGIVYNSYRFSKHIRDLNRDPKPLMNIKDISNSFNPKSNDYINSKVD